MLTKNLAASDLIKQRQAKTVYLNYKNQQQALNEGIRQRVCIQSGSGADNASSQLIMIAEGAQFTAYSDLILDLSNNTSILLSVPSNPTNVTISQYGFTYPTLQASLSWTIPVSNGGSPITSYNINIYNSSNILLQTTNVSGSLNSSIITINSSGTNLYAKMIAVNAMGSSILSSNSLSFNVYDIPSPPTNASGVPLIVASQTNASATVSWTAPTNFGSPITSYTVKLYLNGITLVTGLTPIIVGTNATFTTNLTLGASYTATVIATNAFGPSTASIASSSFTMYSIPSAPTSLSATPTGTNTVLVSWTAGSNGGVPAGTSLTYIVTSSPGGITATTSSSSASVNASVSGLIPSTAYTFTATENNGVATSVASSPSNSATTFPVCLAKGTLVQLFNGLAKVIEAIVYSDVLLVWDFDEGRFLGANPLWIKKSEITNAYNLLKFSCGTTLKTINQHRIFNKELGKFTYPMTDDSPLGTTTFNSRGEEVYLVSKEVVYEEVEFYNVITNRHINLFANTILTSCRYNNIYPIESMRFVKDGRSIAPIESYNVSKIYYDGLRLGEQLISAEDTHTYLANLEALKVC